MVASPNWSGSHVIGQPELQQAAKAAKVAIDPRTSSRTCS
jgi:hypothetical protein